MRKLILAVALVATVLPATVALADPPPWAQNDKHGDRHDRRDERRDDRGRDESGRGDHDRVQWQRYDYNRPDPRYGNYDASRYYYAAPNYGERRLTRDDRIYRGSDNRYYCRRSDGTTGLIIGAVAGGLFGSAVAGRGSSTLGALLGAGGGALLGQSIDRGNVRCR
jgi:hypothetical protein